MRDRVDKVIRRIHDLPTLPSVYKRVNDLLQNPYTSANDIAAVVSEDQVITTKLLRLVNSAHYGFPEKIETVSRAVSLVGMQAVRDLVLATSVMDLFHEEKVEGWSLGEFWRHSLGVAVASRAVAGALKHPQQEEFFVAGLIHDIGKVVWLQYFREELVQVLAESQRQRKTMITVENELLGINHSRVGRLVAKHWGLPDRLIDAIAWHHDPRLSESHMSFVSVIHVADCLANALRMGSSGNGISPWIRPDAWEALGLKPHQFETLVRAIDADFEDSLLLLSFWDEEEKQQVEGDLQKA